MTQEQEYRRILFRFYSDILEQETVETLWAVPVDESLNHYRIDSIPFYVSFIASDDIVSAEFDHDEEMLTYRETIERSGNSIVWVVLLNESVDMEDVQQIFYDLDCESEGISDKYFALEIKAATNYLKIRDQLNQLRSSGIIDFAEPNLSEQHQY